MGKSMRSNGLCDKVRPSCLCPSTRCGVGATAVVVVIRSVGTAHQHNTSYATIATAIQIPFHAARKVEVPVRWAPHDALSAFDMTAIRVPPSSSPTLEEEASSYSSNGITSVLPLTEGLWTGTGCLLVLGTVMIHQQQEPRLPLLLPTALQ